MSNIIRIGGGGDLAPIQLIHNGTYVAENYGVDGFESCIVNVPLDQIKLTEDGEYYANSYNIDGFYKVIVATSEGAGRHGGLNAVEFDFTISSATIS